MQVFTEEGHVNMPIGKMIYKEDIEGELNKINIEIREVEGLIYALSVSKASGPEDIYQKTLKKM